MILEKNSQAPSGENVTFALLKVITFRKGI
jgi:hypothetical protein